MARRSFWEKLGRGVGHGIHKAMELGSQVADQVEGKLDLEKAEEALARDHEALGRAVADTLLGGDEAPRSAEDPAVKDLTEKIRAGRALVEKLRAEREAQEKEAQEREAQEKEAQEKEAQEREGEERAERDDPAAEVESASSPPEQPPEQPPQEPPA
jgi:hypothetical protein